MNFLSLQLALNVLCPKKFSRLERESLKLFLQTFTRAQGDPRRPKVPSHTDISYFLCFFSSQNNQTIGAVERRIETCCSRDRTATSTRSNVTRRAKLQREDNHGLATVIETNNPTRTIFLFTIFPRFPELSRMLKHRDKPNNNSRRGQPHKSKWVDDCLLCAPSD